MHVLRYKLTDACGNAHRLAQKHKPTLSHCTLGSGTHITSHLNFHCNCNQWFPSNVIYFHSILTGPVVKEIGTKQSTTQTKTRKET